MMKKLTSLLLSAALLVGMLACGASAKTNTTVRVAGLKGPTTMGLVNLLAMEKNGTASQNYDLQLYGAADEVVPKLIKGEVDIAAIPANLAATLYQKTNGGIQVMAVNTLGVLYVVEKGDTVHSFADLKGRTILSTGKGTTPEYVLRYLLRKNGIDPDKDVKIEYYSEASEVTAQMAATKKDAIAVLPQPYVTAAQMKDSSLRVVLDLTKEWNKVCDTQLITGVTVVRTAYAEEHPEEVIDFLKDYQKSVDAANDDLDGTAALCEEVGVVAKAAIAKKALPKCNIVYCIGDEMKADVNAYLQVLYDVLQEVDDLLLARRRGRQAAGCKLLLHRGHGGQACAEGIPAPGQLAEVNRASIKKCRAAARHFFMGTGTRPEVPPLPGRPSRSHKPPAAER